VQNGKYMVWKLLKALYGLKQAPRQWNTTLDGTLKRLGYRPLVSDPCVYIKRSKTNELMILCLYVDDTLIVFQLSDLDEWKQDLGAIREVYPIKDLGECHWILNMKITRDWDRGTITLSQEAYVDRILTHFGMMECRPVSTPAQGGNYWKPLPKNHELAKPLNKEGVECYRSAVGALLYAANITRPDIAHTIGRLCRHTAEPNHMDWNAVKRVFRYLRGTVDHCLIFGRNPRELHLAPDITVYADADWASDFEDSKSTSGCLVRFNGDVLNWFSKKQHSVALSTNEAEYMALAEAIKEALWYRSCIQEILSVLICPTIYCDNQSAIKLSKNDCIHDKSKHIRIRYHFIRDEAAKKNIVIKYIPTEKQQADMLTKSLDRIVFIRNRESVMVSSVDLDQAARAL